MKELNEAVESIQNEQGVVLPILQYPHPTLSQKSAVVLTDIKTDGQLQRLLNSMVETMRKTGGLGLAAVQVGALLRVLVVQDGYGNVTKVINPRIVSVSTETSRAKEGCLSFVGLFLDVRRPKEVEIEFFDENGEKRSTKDNGLLGRAIQHEMDHLDGKTFLDRLGQVERSMALSKNKLAKRKVAAMIKRHQATKL